MEEGEKVSVFSRLLKENAGAPILVENETRYYPTEEMLAGIPTAKPSRVNAWHVGRIGPNGLSYDEQKEFYGFGAGKYLSVMGIGNWMEISEPHGIAKKDFISAGKTIELPIPNAYLRSYGRITSTSRIYVGATEIKHFLIKNVGGKRARSLLEEITSALAQDSKH